jgi:DNA primase
MSIVDFATIKARVKMADAVPWLGLQMKQESPGQFRSPCPACKSTDRRALSVNTTKDMFKCFAWGKGGTDAIALVAHIKGVSQRDAAAMLDQAFQASATTPRPVQGTPQPAAERKPGFDAEAYAKRLDPEHPSLSGLEVSAETLKAFNAGYALNGVNAQRLALPLEDAQGKVVGYFGRALSDDKQPLLKFGSDMDPRDYVFNVCRVEEGTEVRLVRDVLDVLTAHEVGEVAICFLTDLIEPAQYERLIAAQHELKFTVYL